MGIAFGKISWGWFENLVLCFYIFIFLDFYNIFWYLYFYIFIFLYFYILIFTCFYIFIFSYFYIFINNAVCCGVCSFRRFQSRGGRLSSSICWLKLRSIYKSWKAQWFGIHFNQQVCLVCSGLYAPRLRKTIASPWSICGCRAKYLIVLYYIYNKLFGIYIFFSSMSILTCYIYSV